MVSLNKVFLVGNLTRDPELRYTPQGSAVVTLGLAVNRSFKDRTGQMQRDTCFMNVVVWGQQAEACNQYLQKGRPIFVEGRLQSRSWQNNEGKNRSVLEVVALRVQFMPYGGGGRQQEAQEIDLGEEPSAAVPGNIEDSENPDLGKVE